MVDLCDGGSVQISGSGLLGCVFSDPFGYRCLYLDYVHAKNETYLLLIPGPNPQSRAMLPSMAVLIIEVCFVIWGKTEFTVFTNFLVKKVPTVEDGYRSGSVYCTVQARTHKTNIIVII
jgi:hypothetical protein